MIDPKRLARLFLDEWQDTEQPIEQRGTILPLGIYEDGSAHLAVPGLIQDGIEGWNALWDDAQAAREGAYPTFDVEQGKRSAGNSLMAAGLAATGGLAAGAAGRLPDNALASNAIRGGMEGQPIRAYRGTPNPETADQSRHIWWGSSSPHVASRYAEVRYIPARDNPTVTPVNLKFSNPMVVDAGGRHYWDIPHGGRNWEELLNFKWPTQKTASTDDLARIAQDGGHDGLVINNVRDPVFKGYVPIASTVAALRPGTVFSATTGEQLFSNPRSAPLAPMALSEDGSDDDFLSALLSRYGVNN